MFDFPQIPQRIDSKELTSIKNRFSLRERINSDLYEQNQYERRNPVVLFDELSTPPQLTQSTLRGLKYPLELDGKGGLKLSYGYDRIGEQILEVLETRLGERAYRPFFGIPEVLFESIDEYALALNIQSQLTAFIPILRDVDVKVSIFENGGVQLIVFYSVEGSESSMVKYSFSL